MKQFFQTKVEEAEEDRLGKLPVQSPPPPETNMYGIWIRVRIRSDPKLFAGSGKGNIIMDPGSSSEKYEK
jgi:hypothetical protein